MQAPAGPPQSPSAPRPIGSPESIFDAVLERLVAARAQRVLDLPAGRGALAQRLLDAGFEVAAADIRPELFELDGLDCTACDLNQLLPFADASFDAVVCCSGLHRIYAVGRAVAEFARIVRPGGTIIVTLPNFGAIKRRVRFLFTGVVSRAAARSGGEIRTPEADFRHPVGILHLAAAAEATGLEMSHIEGRFSRPRRRRPGRIFYLPLIALIQLAARLARPKTQRRYRLRETAAYDALFSDFLLIELRRPRRGSPDGVEME